ncbi:hypothetical protein [Ekhidna sp.]|uniref:hypothetical protein n=1 Tax=Ekhidna sp. TaxID=2608089 RepID=UPI003CCC3892
MNASCLPLSTSSFLLFPSKVDIRPINEALVYALICVDSLIGLMGQAATHFLCVVIDPMRGMWW